MIKPTAYKVHERDKFGRPYWFADGNDSVDVVERAINSVKATPLYDVPIDEIIAVLKWYRDESQATARAVVSQNADAMMASLTVHSLENGRRAEEILEKINAV